MRDERQACFENRQEGLESKIGQLLEHYKRTTAQAAERQDVIEELRERVAGLESEQVERNISEVDKMRLYAQCKNSVPCVGRGEIQQMRKIHQH
jgi:hypothetical protein